MRQTGPLLASRRLLLGVAAAWPAYRPATAQQTRLEAAFTRAAGLEPLHTLIVAQHGTVLAERRFRGPPPDQPVNIKSASKSVLAALVGIAIARGHRRGVDQPMAPLLQDKMPSAADPRLSQITIGNLLAMRAGQERTSGTLYGR
jgi:CubicO group peptidase (beta-lactamase class C family)